MIHHLRQLQLVFCWQTHIILHQISTWDLTWEVRPSGLRCRYILLQSAKNSRPQQAWSPSAWMLSAITSDRGKWTQHGTSVEVVWWQKNIVYECTSILDFGNQNQLSSTYGKDVLSASRDLILPYLGCSLLPGGLHCSLWSRFILVLWKPVIPLGAQLFEVYVVICCICLYRTGNWRKNQHLKQFPNHQIFQIGETFSSLQVKSLSEPRKKRRDLRCTSHAGVSPPKRRNRNAKIVGNGYSSRKIWYN